MDKKVDTVELFINGKQVIKAERNKKLHGIYQITVKHNDKVAYSYIEGYKEEE